MRTYSIKSNNQVVVNNFKEKHESARMCSDFNLKNIYVDYFDERHVLLINSFTKKIEIISNELYLKIKKNRTIGSSTYDHLCSFFNINIDELKNKNNVNPFNKLIHTYIICPTYTCNMACPYCYQQTNKGQGKQLLSDDDLQRIFNFIDNKIINLSDNEGVALSLFGGEPFQKKNLKQVESIFDYVYQKKLILTATSNGVDLELYTKLFAIYRGFIGKICITLDGDQETHNKRRITAPNVNGFNKIVNNINVLLTLGIGVSIAINLDPSNIDSFSEFINIMYKNNWANNNLVDIQIGRVDDRLYELKYGSYFSEGELISYIVGQSNYIDYPSNIRLAFLKSCLSICQMFNISFNQNEIHRKEFSYCWATSSSNECLYIDPNLDAYRCTYSVGRPDFKVGNILQGIDINKFTKNNLFNNPKCFECPIGGFCGGGCFLSCSIDKNRFCEEELKSFSFFIKSTLIPIVKNQLDKNI